MWVSKYTDILHAFIENPDKYRKWAPMTPRLQKRLDNPSWDEKPACGSLFCATVDIRREVGRGDSVEVSVSGCERRPRFGEEVWKADATGPESFEVNLTWDSARRAHVGRMVFQIVGEYSVAVGMPVLRPLFPTAFSASFRAVW